MEQIKIIAAARQVPEQVISNDDLSKIMDTNDEWIYSRTWIHNRHVVNQENTSDLATSVARQLLEKANLSVDEIDFLIVGTMSPDQLSPHTAAKVQGNLGGNHLFAFDLNAACSGFVYGMSVASAFIQSGRYHRGIFIGAEVLSKLVDWQDRSVSVLFGDGAAGVLLEKTTEPVGLLSESLTSFGADGQAIQVGQFANQNAFSEAKTALDPYFHMQGRDVYRFATHQVPLTLQRALDKVTLRADDIDLYLMHQANGRIVESIAKRFGQSMDKFPTNMQEYGNTSAASIGILLDELYQKGRIQPGMKIAFAGFGGGLATGAQIWQV